MHNNSKKHKLVALLLSVCILLGTSPSIAYAGRASYDRISRKFAGYGVSVCVNKDVTNKVVTVSKLVNNKSYSVTTTDTYETTRSITFSTSCSSKISSSIGVTSGDVKGSLGGEIEKKYSFSDNYVRTYTKSITATVPASTTYTVGATIKGDEVVVYYKYFAAWVTTSKGNGKVNVPKYAIWTCS